MAKKQFKAESKRLLDLMINSIYTHKEIFLRELISNASDAEDKLAYKALTDDQVPVDRKDLKITIVPDKEMRTLTVSDNGVGMTREELENNLGTIAKSGSFQFKQDLAKEEKGEDIDVIGQFGVGFYSAFMVADHVTVVSRAYGSDEAWMWQSDGADGYTVTQCEKDAPGSDVIMHLKANADEENYDQYLETYKLQELIKKYSDYIRYPIVMEVEDYRQKEKPADAGDDYKPEWETVKEWKTINSMVPLWQRQKSKVTAEEYNAFYKEKFMDWQDPLAVVHTSAEGAVTYKAMLYIPQKAPYDFYTREYQKGLQLYSSGVLIMDKCADLLPDYFRFVKGVVDSPDFSLNISREVLQHDRQLKVIASALEKKIKGELVKLQKEDPEKYEQFWTAFGSQIKYGVVADYGAHKDNLKDLLLFWSSKEGKNTTLEAYQGRMAEEQPYYYYACGESVDKIAKLPQVERILDKGYEILYCTEDVDDFVMQALGEIDGKKFKSATAEDALPQTLTSYSPCFRKEKGSHGIEERGVYRIHQFEKQEMIVVCKPEESMDWYEKMWRYSVELFRSLDIPVRQLECCSGDLADLKVKSCDIEAWSPRQQKYFEVCSCSNLGDAQARRLKMRVKGERGTYLPHTLNNTVVAPPRMLIAFLENNLQADGSVKIPEVLWPYMGGTQVLVPKHE